MFNLIHSHQSLAIIWLSAILAVNPLQAANKHDILNKIRLPSGFNISLFSDNTPNARSMALGDNGIIFVGSRNAGNVYALQDSNNDGKADHRYLIASGLNMPNGVAYRHGSLYVAEVNRIIRYDNISQLLHTPPKPITLYQLPNKRHHGWKYLRFGPDNKLYTAVGAPCNICEPDKEIFSSLIRLNADGSNMEILARGIRNTVGFDWQPDSNILYFTENGSDWLGDDIPADELNKWSQKGQHFGFPYCHAGDIPDPKFGQQQNCSNYVAPEWKFKAHMAAVGIRFYRGQQFPSNYHKQLFVAQHGSWNRSTPHGYRIVWLQLQQGKVISEQVFAEGWLKKNGKAIGRPVDILELKDGSLLVSDDLAGVIYRISYQR
jgi:glucose/arabinose dehydrogenase